MKKIIAIILLAFSVPMVSNAQVTDVNYKVRYNSATCRYDVILVVLAGSATTSPDRTVQTAQLTLVVPTGTIVGAEVPNEPKSTTAPFGAVAWPNSTQRIAPAASPTNDFYAFTAPVSGSRYSAVAGPGEVVLFSVPISTTGCGSGIRLFVNGTDPNSAAVGMGGGDFSNSFPMGQSLDQLYSGNAIANVAPTGPTISNIVKTSVGNVVSLLASTTASPCSPIVSYAWTTSSAATGNTINANPGVFTGTLAQQAGSFAVTVKDANGCIASLNTRVVLPVTLSTFEATAKDCKAVIEWTTSEEKNADRFEIEHSVNGKEWSTIGAVKAANTTGGKYSFVDVAPAAGDNQYRLKMVDLNGASSNSQVRSIKNDCAVKAEIIVYPTDVTNDVYVALPVGDEDAQVMLLNNLGQVIKANAHGNGTQLQSFSMNFLAAGQYMVRVVTKTEAKTFKVIKH